MKCPECKSKIKKGVNVCPSCKHELTAEDFLRRNKKKKTRVWIIIASVVAFFVGIVLLMFLPTDVYFSELKIKTDILEYEEFLEVTVEYESIGALKADVDVPVYVDDKVVHTCSMDFSGSEIKSESFRVATGELIKSGDHVLKVEDTEIAFKVLTPADLTISCDFTEDIFLTGKEYTVDYKIENEGESSTDVLNEVLFKDEIIKTDEFIIDGKSFEDFTCLISSDEPGTFDLYFNEVNYPVDFYISSRFETGDSIKDNTVKGYSYFLIDNQTDKDIIAIVTTTDDPTLSVAARYIQSGDEYKFRSFVHGEYLVYFQTGKSWIPEIYRFGEEEQYYSPDYYNEFKNSVHGGYGTYQYYEFDITQTELDTYYTRIYDNFPSMY